MRFSPRPDVFLTTTSRGLGTRAGPRRDGRPRAMAVPLPSRAGEDVTEYEPCEKDSLAP
jgi:hypothetical protein